MAPYKQVFFSFFYLNFLNFNGNFVMWTIVVMATLVVITHKRNCPNLAIGKRGLRPFTRQNNKSNKMKNESWTTYTSLLGHYG